MFKLIFLPLKLVIGFLKLSGVKGVLLLAIGVGVGLLVAPQRGAQLRAQLKARVDEQRGGTPVPGDADLSV